jgi:hypothetical protein
VYHVKVFTNLREPPEIITTDKKDTPVTIKMPVTIQKLEFQGFHEDKPIYSFDPINKKLGFLTETSGGGKIKRKWSKRRRLRLLKKRVSRKRRRRRSKGPKA